MNRAGRGAGGFSLAEALVALVVLGLLTGLGVGPGRELRARQELEGALRQLALGLERGRQEAERRGGPCALELTSRGWRGVATAAAPACEGAHQELEEGPLPAQLLLRHTFAGPVEFSANGLAVDGGTAVLGSRGTALQRCLVMAPPLGVARQGHYRGESVGSPDPARCLPEPLE
jgi:hypothetical protein